MTGFAGKRVLVVGLGVSGFATARALAGLDAKVRVTERSASGVVADRAAALRSSGVDVEIGGHSPEGLDADLAVLSSGISPASEVARSLAAAHIETIGELELAWRLSDRRFIAVTGTNGKTTTTTLVAAILTEGGTPTVAAGNIGVPLVEAVLASPPDATIVAEVSSFQLASITSFRPAIASILNVAEDHTDWHGTFDDYARAKARIVEFQQPGDHVVFNAADEVATRIALRAASEAVGFSAEGPVPGGIGIGPDGGILWRDRRLMTRADVPLSGRAGLEDCLAAAACGLLAGADADAVVRAVKGFRPLPHRLERIATVEGVTYIDDSKATNPHAAAAAVMGLRDVVLIAGGRSKGIDLSPMRAMAPPVVAVVAIGEARGELAEVFSGVAPVEAADSMEEAVRIAAGLAGRRGSVLLSPGCASLDMYESYAVRGEEFARAVRALAAGSELGGRG